MMNARWQNYFSKIIKCQLKGAIPSLLRIFLLPLSWAFQFAGNCRNWAFENNFLSSYTPPIPLVISIGNIVVGGTGKTPVTLFIAEEFYANHRIAILSRGYRSAAEKRKIPTILSSGAGPCLSAEDCGDEPYLLAQNLPNATVIVGRDRRAAAHMAVREGAQLILLDDGLQHRRVARDFDVVVMHAENLFGHGHFLPRGLLREPPKALSRADLIILNHVKDSAHYFDLVQKLKKFTKSPIIGVQMQVKCLYDASGLPVESLFGKRVGLFCGIANPEQFQKTMQSQGAQVVATELFPDHCTFDKEGLKRFSEMCRNKGAEALVCTEKDFVKLCEPSELALPLIWPKMGLCIVEGETNWKSFIEKAKRKL